MNITVLMENTSYRPDAVSEHGLSLYIETKRHKLLFDMGQSDGFAKNAALLHVDLDGVDLAVLSHGHFDHGGGMKRFIELNKRAKIYINSRAFEPRYSASEQYIGLDITLIGNSRFVPVADNLRIDDELELFSCNDLPRPYPTDSAGLKMLLGEQMVPDDFSHEQYLLIHDGERRILISGCSHKGILNLMKWFHPDVLIGGFHFMNLDLSGEGEQTLRRTAELLCAYPTKYYTCHCTGLESYAFLKALMGEKLDYLAGGQRIKL